MPNFEIFFPQNNEFSQLFERHLMLKTNLKLEVAGRAHLRTLKAADYHIRYHVQNNRNQHRHLRTRYMFKLNQGDRTFSPHSQTFSPQTFSPLINVGIVGRHPKEGRSYNPHDISRENLVGRMSFCVY